MANATKAIIIENTRNYLKAKGILKNISLSAILSDIGVSKGTFYYYFKDKNALLYEVIIPDIEQKEIEISKQVSKFPTLKERLHFMFELFTNENLSNELNEVENFYLYLLHHTGDSKFFATIYDKIRKSRKGLILRQIRYFNITITKDINILLDYIHDTVIFYHIFNKKLKGKAPRREIANFVDMLCRLIESQKSTKKVRFQSAKI